jgi:hypothetical protein
MTKTLALTSEQVCDLAKITYRQLDYWTRQDWVKASAQRPGSGNVRFYSATETARVALMAQLVQARIPPELANRLTRRGEYDAEGVFRACISGHVYVEVFP